MFLLSCTGPSRQPELPFVLFERPGYIFPYRLAEPAGTWKLPAVLNEISGISLAGDGRLACVQDEQGIIFIFNPRTGEIEKEIAFGGPGDYEDITVIGEDAWVVRSDGRLFHVSGFLEDGKLAVKEHPTVLSEENNVEGLAYDPVTGKLLVACKDMPFHDGRKGEGQRAVYSFDMGSDRMDQDPVLLIHTDTVMAYRQGDHQTGAGEDQYEKAVDKKRDKVFKPSGIAVHPKTNDIYVIASAGKLLLVISRTGEILALVGLGKDLMPQPEGICFGLDESLFISSEGEGREGRILKFRAGSQ